MQEQDTGFAWQGIVFVIVIVLMELSPLIAIVIHSMKNVSN